MLLADGTYKPIEKIKVGDKVLATDPTTGKTQAKKVTAAFSGTSYDHLVQITVDTDGRRGHKTGAITATEHHLFWNPLRRTWLRADRLTRGQKLYAASVGAVGITDVVGVTGHPRVHELTVADIHTFYVEAGDTPVLVHNDGADDYNQAMNRALAWLDERGFKAERTTYGKFGTIAGKPIGSQTADGKTGFRIEFDERNGAHINVWNGKERGPHFNFDASEATVAKIQGRFGCK